MAEHSEATHNNNFRSNTGVEGFSFMRPSRGSEREINKYRLVHTLWIHKHALVHYVMATLCYEGRRL